MPKMIGNNRPSALKRLSAPYSTTKIDRRPIVGLKPSSINDARQILVNRNQTSFDARQLLSRQASKTSADDDGQMVVVTGLKDMKMKDGRLVPTPTMVNAQEEKKKKIYAVGTSTFVTIRNANGNTSSTQSTEKISLTKTIKNPSVRRDDDAATPPPPPSSSNQKVLISFVNDKYEKNPSPPVTSTKHSSSPLTYHRDPPPVIKRLHDASIQTASSSSASRSPIRMSSYRRQRSPSSEEDTHSNERTIGDDLYEPPVKRSTSSTRKTTTTTEKEQPILSTSSVKRTATGASVSSRTASSISTVSKESSSAPSTGTILVTNLQPSVTEDDVIELFGQLGRIAEIKTLSEGCVRINYAKREHAEQAVTKYHNRLLDGQFMYVSLQQTASQAAPQPAKPKSVIQQPTKETGTSSTASSTSHQPLKSSASTSSTSSNKIIIDPNFFRQALFHPTNNSNNPVQFQVKL